MRPSGVTRGGGTREILDLLLCIAYTKTPRGSSDSRRAILTERPTSF